MAIIGTFTEVENGYEGTIETLTISASVVLEKRQKTKDKQPDYDVFANGREIGAAWERMGFLSVYIDDPSAQRRFAKPMTAPRNLDSRLHCESHQNETMFGGTLACDSTAIAV